MDVELLDGGIEYVDDQETASLTVEFHAGTHDIDPVSLQHLGELRDHDPDVDPDEIAAVLGYAVGTFDGDLRYHGRVAGTDLCYDVVDSGNEAPILVVSFGEVQPGRYAFAAEALVRTGSNRP